MIRVCIVYDVAFYGQALAQVLTGGDILVAGVANVEERNLVQIAESDPDVVLLDLLPGLNGALASIRKRAPRAKIIVLGVPGSGREAMSCAGAGVCGYASRESSVEDLIRTVRSVAQGDLVYPSTVVAVLLKGVAALELAGMAATNRKDLTARELEIARLISKGLSNKEIASGLAIELYTVKTHIHNILRKLRVKRRSEVVARLLGDGRLAP